jgi:hypothetical protein
MTTRTRPPLPAHAERLWLNLQSNLLDFNKTLIEIIEVEAWKPVYETFTDAYEDKLSNISFARELLPHLMYAMFDQGATPKKVADAVKGVTTEVARNVKKQKDAGLPANKATTYIRRRTVCKMPEPKGILRMELGVRKLNDWKRKAARNNTTVEAVVLSAADAAFAELQ